jgi:hypothetical protein
LENGGREAAERIATVEKHGLAITRQHCDILALGVGNGKTIEVDPITVSVCLVESSMPGVD